VGIRDGASANPTSAAASKVGVRDIILPGDMEVILAKVVEAERVARANAIRRVC
jgi:hypothetical protein